MAAVVIDPFLLRQARLVIDVQRHDHEVVAQAPQYLRIRPHARFHLPAVDAAVAREIKKNRLARSLGGREAVRQVVVGLQAVGDGDRPFASDRPSVMPGLTGHL